MVLIYRNDLDYYMNIKLEFLYTKLWHKHLSIKLMNSCFGFHVNVFLYLHPPKSEGTSEVGIVQKMIPLIVFTFEGLLETEKQDKHT